MKINRIILYLCRIGLAPIILSALSTGCDTESERSVNMVNPADFPDPAMLRAAQFAENGQVSSAIEAARDVPGGLNFVSPTNNTLLLIAIRNDDVVTAQTLLAAGANPNIPSKRAPLAIAVSIGSFRLVETLLERGADPNGADGSEAALWRAAFANRMDVARLLVEHGAQVDRANADGQTPALIAATANRFRMVDFLLAQGASCTASSSGGYTIGYWAAGSRVPPASDEGKARERVIGILRSAGCPWPPPDPSVVVAARAQGAPSHLGR